MGNRSAPPDPEAKDGGVTAERRTRPLSLSCSAAAARPLLPEAIRAAPRWQQPGGALRARRRPFEFEPGAAVPGAPSGAGSAATAAVSESRFAPAGGAAPFRTSGSKRLLGPRPLRAAAVTFPVPSVPGGGRCGAHRGRCDPGSPPSIPPPPEGTAAACRAYKAAFSSRISEQRFLQEEPPVPAENISKDVRSVGQRKAREPAVPFPR